MELAWRPRTLRWTIQWLTVVCCACLAARAVWGPNGSAIKARHGFEQALAARPGDLPPEALRILRRNIFDPLTGPLPKPDPPPRAADAVSGADPAALPGCSGNARLVASLWSVADEASSIASVSSAGGPPRLYRAGSELDARRVVAVYPEAVVLEGTNGVLCALALFERTPGPLSVSAAGPTVVPEVEFGISTLEPDRYRVRRGLIDRLLKDPAELLRTVRAVPYSENGRTIGVRLFGLSKQSLLSRLGLLNGGAKRPRESTARPTSSCSCTR